MSRLEIDGGAVEVTVAGSRTRPLLPVDVVASDWLHAAISGAGGCTCRPFSEQAATLSTELSFTSATDCTLRQAVCLC